MNEVSVVLFTDSSPDSVKARKALRDAGVIFREWNVKRDKADFDPPLLVSTIGEYKGVNVIESYAKAIAKVVNNKE